VIVVGAGHTGLEVAARLKNLGVPTLVVEQHPRIGDNVPLSFYSASVLPNKLAMISGEPGTKHCVFTTQFVRVVFLAITIILKPPSSEGYNTTPYLPFVQEPPD
jgi:flavin-dependent dehydrogenase